MTGVKALGWIRTEAADLILWLDGDVFMCDAMSCLSEISLWRNKP